MKIETVSFKDDMLEIVVTVHTSTGVDEMRRHRVRYEQSQIDEADPDRRLLRLATYPDLISCAKIEVNGVVTVPDFEAFANFDGAFMNEWEAAVYRINPHWSGTDEKKVTT
jgi:hypothetical protein